MTDPQRVLVGEEHVGWACSACGSIFCFRNYGRGDDHPDEFVKGCATKCCNQHCECGAPVEKGRTICSPCAEEREAKQEKARFEKAEKLDWKKYDGPVYDQSSEKYYRNIDGFFEDQEGLCPAYLWACDKIPFELDAQAIVEDALLEHYDDAAEHISLKAIEELQTFLNQWAAKQSIESWEANNKKALPLKNTCSVCGITLFAEQVGEEQTHCDGCRPE